MLIPVGPGRLDGQVQLGQEKFSEASQAQCFLNGACIKWITGNL